MIILPMSNHEKDSSGLPAVTVFLIKKERLWKLIVKLKSYPESFNGAKCFNTTVVTLLWQVLVIQAVFLALFFCTTHLTVTLWHNR